MKYLWLKTTQKKSIDALQHKLFCDGAEYMLNSWYYNKNNMMDKCERTKFNYKLIYYILN